MDIQEGTSRGELLSLMNIWYCRKLKRCNTWTGVVDENEMDTWFKAAEFESGSSLPDADSTCSSCQSSENI